MNLDRRHFERFSLAEEVVAFDEQGQRLGRVTIAGGGGMAIQLDSARPYACGQQLRLRLVESATGIQHIFAVSVRYLHDDLLGMQFVNHKGDTPAEPAKTL